MGLTTVPFGILPYTGNNYFLIWAIMPVSRTMRTWGIKYLFPQESVGVVSRLFPECWLLPELVETHELSASRYAYDIAGRDKEVHQGNVRVVYHFGNLWRQQLGGSVLVGGLYNMDTRKTGVPFRFRPYTTSSTINGGTLKYTSCFWTVSACTMILACWTNALLGSMTAWRIVTGCSLTMGKVFSYIDYAVGRNHAWLGDV